MTTNSIQTPLSVLEMLRLALPWFGVSREVAIWRLKNLPNFFRGFWRIAIARALGVPHFIGQLSLQVTRPSGEMIDYGLVSLRVITQGGVGLLTDVFQAQVNASVSTFKYHGFGEGTTAEQAADIALEMEASGAYLAANTRPTGSQIEGAGTNVYRTVATFTPDMAIAVTEHGLFNINSLVLLDPEALNAEESEEPEVDPQAGAGQVMWDRSVFAVISLNGAGDSLQATYDCTFLAGG